MPYRTVQMGKLRRYWSVQNLVDPFRLPVGLLQSMALVRGFRPHVAFAAGGFAAVPPLLAASLWRVPTKNHQQDLVPGLANRILAPFATAVTVTFPQSMAHFPPSRSKLTGNPVRQEILSGSRGEAIRLFGLEEGLPVVLVTGGGTGALGLNRLVAVAAERLAVGCQILHITGKGKAVVSPYSGPRYHQREFLVEGMGHALAVADLVVSRAGLSTLSELAALGKPSLLIPMPHSHQEANAAAFSAEAAAVVLEEEQLDPERLAGAVLSLLSDRDRLGEMGRRASVLMPPGAEARIADEILRLAGEREY
jgi:UDP-N-acetylglucosamine--N-acetylmuramyl-(pentapeptide) pyrophosphoryl-undecaprenol N-acetylglucosamine transferase